MQILAIITFKTLLLPKACDCIETHTKNRSCDVHNFDHCCSVRSEQQILHRLECKYQTLLLASSVTAPFPQVPHNLRFCTRPSSDPPSSEGISGWMETTGKIRHIEDTSYRRYVISKILHIEDTSYRRYFISKIHKTACCIVVESLFF